MIPTYRSLLLFVIRRVHLNMTKKIDRQRIPRFVGSCCFLGLTLIGIVFISNDQQVSPFFGSLALLAYSLLSSILIVGITSRLYRHHELKKLKFDLASLILLTVLLALPFGLSNTLWEHFMLDYSAEMKDNKTMVLLFLPAAAAFLFLPIFFVTEALLSWCTLAIQTYRSTDHANP